MSWQRSGYKGPLESNPSTIDHKSFVLQEILVIRLYTLSGEPLSLTETDNYYNPQKSYFPLYKQQLCFPFEETDNNCTCREPSLPNVKH